MLPELGHFALIIALCLAIVQGIFPIAGAARGNANMMAMARPVAQGQFVFLAIAFGILVYAFIDNDFSVAYAAHNSNSKLPLGYRISAVWGAHEGSLLLWSFILSIWMLAVTLFSRSLPERFVARVLGVMGLVSTGFLLFLIMTSNPFERMMPVPLDGADLNPLLQDIGLIIHPPMLYMGYVGFSVAFGFAIAALLDGRMDAAWARWSRPWTTVAWVFLTIGIALGSWWAYYELGWGGWWFWDPVENASFMPWLVGTALIHSLAATEKRNVFKHWTVLLAICAFSLSLLGTFLVRSGVLTSVHAFATDPSRGIFILAYLVIVIGGSLALYAWRAPSSLSGTTFKPVSREGFLLVNNILLVVAMASILLGTLYPLVVDALGLGKLSVGPPYFNAVFLPFMILVGVFQAIGSLSRWKQDTGSRLAQHLKYAAIACLAIGVTTSFMFYDDSGIKAGVGILIAAWVFFGVLIVTWQQVSKKQNKLAALGKLSLSFYGMSFAHIGFAISIIGVTMSSLYSTEEHVRMAPGDSQEVGGYVYTFTSIKEVEGPNYSATEGRIDIYDGETLISTLRPQKRIYHARNMPMTEAGIQAGLFKDLYVSMGEPLGNDGAWSLRLYFKPFIRWIWLGAIFMGFGGILAICDRRYRLKVRKTQGAAVSASNATA